MAERWLTWHVLHGSTVIYEDGHWETNDAETILTDALSAFVQANCLRPPDVCGLRVELRHGATILAEVDGRDW